MKTSFKKAFTLMVLPMIMAAAVFAGGASSAQASHGGWDGYRGYHYRHHYYKPYVYSYYHSNPGYGYNFWNRCYNWLGNIW